MKKIIIIFLSCMLLYPSLVLAKGQTPIEIPIHTGDSPGERPRSQSKIPITCYLYENNNTMSLISASAASLLPWGTEHEIIIPYSCTNLNEKETTNDVMVFIYREAME